MTIHLKEGWIKVGRPNSWPSSVRRHYFREGVSLCKKYSIREDEYDLLDPPEKRFPQVDCVICTRKLEAE